MTPEEDPYRLSAVGGTEVRHVNRVINIETDHLPVLAQGYATSITLSITNTAQYKLTLGLP